MEIFVYRYGDFCIHLLRVKHPTKHYKIKVFDIMLSEYENMKANGYNKIFDCGNLVYEK